MATFYFWKGDYDDQWYFQLKGKNEEVIFASTMGYHNEQACHSAITSVRQYASNFVYYEKFMGADYKYYFKLKATNNELIGRSHGYNTTQSRDQAILTCSIEAPVAFSRKI